jgi:hypothetical protein
VIIHRLRLEHTHLTHLYLLEKELPPVCDCDCGHTPLTIEHILLHCTSHAGIIERFFNCDFLEDLFSCICCHVIVNFIKEIGLYHKL